MAIIIVGVIIMIMIKKLYDKIDVLEKKELIMTVNSDMKI